MGGRFDGSEGNRFWPASRRSSAIGTESGSSDSSSAAPPTAARAAKTEKLATVPGWMRQSIAERAKLVGAAGALQEVPPWLKQVVCRQNIEHWVAALDERGSCSPIKEYTRGPKRKLQGDSLKQLLESGERGEYGTQGEFARIAGVDQATVSREFGARCIERGEDPITNKAVFKLQDEGNLPRIFDMHLSWMEGATSDNDEDQQPAAAAAAAAAAPHDPEEGNDYSSDEEEDDETMFAPPSAALRRRQRRR